MWSFISRRARALQIVFDAICVYAAWAASYLVRFHVMKDGQEGLWSTFTGWAIPLILLTLYFFLKNGHYDRHRQVSVTAEVMQLFRANAMSVIVFIITLYFFSETRVSRLSIVLYAAISTVLLIGVRLAMRSMIRKMRRRGFLLQRVFVVGDGDQILRYLETVDYTPGTGFKVTGLFGAGADLLTNVAKFEIETLESKIAEQKPDVIVLGFKDPASKFVAEFIGRHYDDLMRIQVLPAENQALLGMTADTIDGLHIMTLNEPRLSVPELTAKRALDFFGSLIGLILISPLLAIIALLVRLSSPGPIFFGQERVGIDGATFKMWKFRSMRMASPEESRGWTVENDPRRTKIGTFIRSTSLDELPQLWNVLVGDMSLVGPRPEQTHFVDKFRKEIPAYMLRHRMRAGITGWAQVNGWRGDTSLHKRIECDLFYIRNWTIWFDIKILLMTVVRGFINKNAY